MFQLRRISAHKGTSDHLTLLFLKLILCQKSRHHQFPDWWLDGHKELPSVIADKNNKKRQEKKIKYNLSDGKLCCFSDLNVEEVIVQEK